MSIARQNDANNYMGGEATYMVTFKPLTEVGKANLQEAGWLNVWFAGFRLTTDVPISCSVNQGVTGDGTPSCRILRENEVQFLPGSGNQLAGGDGTLQFFISGIRNPLERSINTAISFKLVSHFSNFSEHS